MKIVKFALVLVCILSIAAICGCMKTKWKVNDQTFDTSEEALNYMKVLDKEFKVTITDKIIPTKTPVGGKAYLFMPSKALFEKSFDAVNEKMEVKSSEETKKFIIETRMLPTKVLWERIKNRKIFDEVIYKVSDDPEKDAMGIKDAIVIYRKVLMTGPEQTFVRKAGGEPVLILFNAALKDKPLESEIYFLDQIEKAAK